MNTGNPILDAIRNIVILTGAGVSAESGIDTFRSEGGLWEQHRVEDAFFIGTSRQSSYCRYRHESHQLSPLVFR